MNIKLKMSRKLPVLINIISHKDSDVALNKHTRSDNKEIMMGSETYDIINKSFESVLQRHQVGL